MAVTIFASNVARIKRGRRRRGQADAKSWSSAAPCIASSAWPARPAISTACSVSRQGHYSHLPPDKVVALCTGSQGEPRAALARIAEDEHPEVELDRATSSSSRRAPSPATRRRSASVINGLIEQGVDVITDRTLWCMSPAIRAATSWRR